jgi:hypothetical protein
MPKLRRLAALLSAGLLIAACSPNAPTSPPTGAPSGGPPASDPAFSGPPDDAVYAAIRADVEAIRGLESTADVAPVVIDAATLLANLEAEFDVENTAEELAFSESVLRDLGLLAADASLRQVTLDFQAGQVAGYYSPDKDELFVVRRSSALTPGQRVAYAHEFTHQLQDQTFKLDALDISDVDQSDRSLARLALIEGDAVSVQNAWTLDNLSQEELGQLLAESLDPEALQALRRAPAFLRETALFPYIDGAAFVERLLAGGGYAGVDAAYDALPDSTEQILHPDRYLDREAPVDVVVDAGVAGSLGSGWADAGQDTLGELILRVWLREGGVSAAEARVAAAGWGGDRLALFRGPGGAETMLLVTEWDTVGDAAEFAAGARTARQGLGLDGKVVLDERAPRVYVALGDGADEIAPRFFTS